MLHRLPETIVFYDPAYPSVCSEEMLAALMPEEFCVAHASDLAVGLGQGCATLVSFHGAYFPKDAWIAILRFLEAGGNLAVFGDMPFTRPVRDDGVIEPEQQAYTDQLCLGPFFPLDLDLTEPYLMAAPEAAFLGEYTFMLASPGRLWSSYPKMTQVSDHPEDMGSAGSLDTVLIPLLALKDRASPSGQSLATPAFLLDQLHGRFKGGRWLISAWEPASETIWQANSVVIRQLITLASQGPALLDVRPELACYRPGETSTLVISSRSHHTLQVVLAVSDPDYSPVQQFEMELAGSSLQQEVRQPLLAQIRPGLYHVTVSYRAAQGLWMRQETGFWLWDESLVAALQDQRLTAGRDYFYQRGRPFLVCGTTYMDSKVQRKFLYLPNPARWDRDFAAMQVAGINLIRTGIWTAWRELMPIAGYANETLLRALDAFVMTACKHRLQMIFTFFSFSPPLFEGQNPWLDPRSLEGQQDFIGAFARRYARVELVSWDLINEPSFGDPQRIFSARPVANGDHFELDAFQNWLAERYSLNELQLRWRQTPADLPSWAQISLPAEKDYNTLLRSAQPRNMLKVMDYTRFSQEMFAAWAARMYDTIRSTGCRTLIGVGQDEAGARLAPQFYASSVDYTTTHPWWNNDDLLWDMLIDKTLATPNLIQETGVMLAVDVDMRPWRSEQESAYLLERKLITGLAARSAGLIQWLWHCNAYMTSENENSIGLVRADGSPKPELAVMQEFGRLIHLLGPDMLETTPDVWVVIPYSQWFLRPEMAIQSTRQAVRVLGYDCGIVPQLVSEYEITALLRAGHHPRCIILPGLQVCERTALQALREFVREGATLLVSGVVTRDQHNLTAPSGLFDVEEDLNTMPAGRYEYLENSNGQIYQLLFENEKSGYVRKAHNRVKISQDGQGQIIWLGLPLELSASLQTIRYVYRLALNLHARSDDENSSLLIVRQPLREGCLVLCVSESSKRQRVVLDEGIVCEVAPSRAGALIIRDQPRFTTFGGIRILTDPA